MATPTDTATGMDPVTTAMARAIMAAATTVPATMGTAIMATIVINQALPVSSDSLPAPDTTGVPSME
jgi:hypothetical protein